MNTQSWYFTHNNEPAIVVDVPKSVTREADVIRLCLEKINKTDTPHPCRAWPVKEMA